MRLYSLVGATSVPGPDGSVIEPDESGTFEFPEEFGRAQHAFHAGGKPMWEDEVERSRRILNEEIERRKDPASLYDAVAKLVGLAEQRAEPEQDDSDGKKPSPRRSGGTAAKSGPRSS